MTSGMLVYGVDRLTPTPPEMKKEIILTMVSVSLCTLSNADVIYTAPGMEQAGSVTGKEISELVKLGTFWEYQITGITWQLSAGVPDGGSIAGSSGNFKHSFVGAASLSVAKGGDSLLRNAELTAVNVNDASSGSITFATPWVYKSESVSISIDQLTNMIGDSGTYVAISGVSVKEPPVPSGDLQVSNVVREGASPTISWIIKREGVYGTAPSISTSGVSWISGTGTEGGPDVIDAPNVGRNKTNNGHGNNIDGVDVSNPGKSAQKWADNKGIIDQSLYDIDPDNDDDEGQGGGSAVSQQNQ